LVGEICATHPITTSLNRFSISFDANLPLAQDIVVMYEADRVVMSGHSIITETMLETTTQTITAGGGGGSDDPVTGLFLIPAYSRVVPGITLDDRVRRTGNIQLVRPLAGDVSFTLTAYAIDPVYMDVNLSEPLAIEVIPDQPVQVFHLSADIAIPFGLEIIAANGASSQFDHSPERAIQSGLNAFRYVDLFAGQFINSYPQWHQGDGELEGVTSVTLSYYGRGNFRIVVVADGSYTLNYIPSRQDS
jgi:hypothetical protein